MKSISARLVCCLAVIAILPGFASAQDSYMSSSDFAKYAMKLREASMLKMEPQVTIPTQARTLSVSGKYPWKMGIVTTTFWIGEPIGGHPPHRNISSVWDAKWMQSFGGVDNPSPTARRNFIPANFVPRQNPFYIALPYNDVERGTTKPEAKVVIPWFREAFVEEGKSVCHDRWIAIRNSAGKLCYAQWSDCGPYRHDHWQYVFGNEKPKPNGNGGAGLNISPAVRDFLGLNGTDVADWKFVDFREVPRGPWSLYGDNNQFVQGRSGGKVVVDVPLAPRPSPAPPTEPTIITRKTAAGEAPAD